MTTRRSASGPTRWGRALRTARRNAELSQAELSDRVDVSESTIRNYENGRTQRVPPERFFVDVEEALGIGDRRLRRAAGYLPDEPERLIDRIGLSEWGEDVSVADELYAWCIAQIRPGAERERELVRRTVDMVVSQIEARLRGS